VSLTLPLAGQKLRASVLAAAFTAINDATDTLAGRVEVKYAYRDTNGTNTTTGEQGYLRLDNIPIVNGDLYLAVISPMIFQSSAAGDLIQILLRGSTSGAATNASAALHLLADTSQTAGGAQKTKGFTFRYQAGTTGNLSLRLSYLRFSGSGNVRINASSDIPVQMSVFRMGPGQADTGVDE